MQISNGNLQTDKITEWTDLDKAKVKYHDLCRIFWNTPEVVTGYVFVMDSQGNILEDYKEFITHPTEQV
jgi:hypothetical protein